MQALPDSAMSLCISEMGGTEGRDGEPGVQGQLYFNIGLHNGVLLRTVVDQVTGDLSDTRTRFIRSRPVKLFRVTMQGGEAVLAMSSRTWISYYYSNRFHLTPFSYDTQRKIQMAEEMQEAAGEDEQELANEMAEAFLTENLPESVFGAPKARSGMWASCIRLMNPISGNTVQLINLDQNDSAMSISLCKFPHMDPSSTFCLVGVAKDYQLSPRSVAGGSIHVYRIVHGGQSLELIHRTSVDEVPYIHHLPLPEQSSHR